jgi:pyrimidine operon attenuation protein/uracil phosphoribosyltransferase
MSDIQIRKRGEGMEGWNFDKLLASITKSGVPLADAKRVAESIEVWARDAVKVSAIDSIKLRDKVIESLKEDYPAEADSYQVYKKG